MQFTPQQIAGAQRYGSRTRIGNWDGDAEVISLQALSQNSSGEVDVLRVSAAESYLSFLSNISGTQPAAEVMKTALPSRTPRFKGERYEDERSAEARFSSFTEKKERNLLTSDYRRKKMNACMQKVPLSSGGENLVRYGSVIQLESAEIGGMLACDPFEETSLGSQLYMATVSPSTSHAPSPARMAFKVIAVTDPRLKSMATQVQTYQAGRDTLPDTEGEPVRFGDLFHLACDKGLRVCETVNMRRPPLFLASALKTQNLSSRVSNKQAVFLRSGASSSTVWQFQKTTHGKDGGVERILGVGSPVSVGSEIVVQHRDTLMGLSCDRNNVEPTDFGAEFETAAAASKAELQGNRWVVRQGQHETVENNEAEHERAKDRQLPPQMTADNLLKEARKIVQRRPGGIHCLRNALRSIDPSGNGKLDREDVRWCLHDYGVALDEEQSQILLDKYDRHASGLVDIEDFLSGLREPLSDLRKNVVAEAFRALALNGDGKVTRQVVQDSFDIEETARFLYGGTALPMETLDALRAGLRVSAGYRSQSVTLADFERYHQDLCVDREDDDLFEAVVKSAWRTCVDED